MVSPTADEIASLCFCGCDRWQTGKQSTCAPAKPTPTKQPAYTFTNGPLATASTPWLSCVQKKPKAPYRLVVFPWTGNRGGAGIDLNLRSKAWDLPDIEVWELLLPGHGARIGETPPSNAAVLLRDLAEPVALALQGGKPYCFLGIAFGAVLAWEISRAISARPPPFGGGDHQREGPALLVAASAEDPFNAIHSASSLHTLSDEAFEAMLRARGGTDQGLLDDEGIKDLFIGIIRADIALEETYTPPAADGHGANMPLMVFRGVLPGKDKDRTWVSEEAAQQWSRASANGFCKVVPVEGEDYLFLEHDKGVAALMSEVHQYLRVKAPA